MARLSETEILARTIIETHDGKTFFSLTEARKIIGCGENTPAALFHRAGITVKKIGSSKKVSALDIAEVMCFE